MGMELADDITDSARRFLELGRRFQAQLAHRIHDTPLYRLEAVSHMGQRPVEDDVHGIIQVSLFRILFERHLFDAVAVNFENLSH